MIHVTGPALVIILVVGYLGVNTIAEKIGSLFKGDENADKNKK